WLELGDWHSANDELENITAPLRAHPDVLKVRFHVYAAAKHWDLALVVAEALVRNWPGEPEAWIRRSFALHELKRTQEARALLVPAATKFQNEAMIPYNLACYACQLGQMDEARRWFDSAIAVGDADEVKLMALDDPDLAPL